MCHLVRPMCLNPVHYQSSGHCHCAIWQSPLVTKHCYRTCEEIVVCEKYKWVTMKIFFYISKYFLCQGVSRLNELLLTQAVT